MKLETRRKYLFKNTFLFSIGSFGSKLISFFLVPLYTNILNTAEYGTIDLMTVIGAVFVPIISLNISEAIMRFSMDKDVDKNNILSIGVTITVISIVFSLMSILIFNLFEITSNFSVFLALYMMTFCSSTIFLCYLRGIEKLLDYSIISIIQSFSIAILNILFLIIFKMGINGYIIAYIISYFITIVLCLFRGNVFKTLKKFKIEKKLLKEMLKYSVPLIPNALMWWIMNSLDRVMVTSMIDVEANGIYAVSYKIPAILMTITTIFNQAWMFSAVKEKDSKDKNEYTTSVFKSLSTSVMTVSIFLLLILKILLKFYVGESFYTAWKYVPPLLVGTIFLTLGTFLSNEYTAHKDSRGFLISSTLGAIINLILNFIMIPRIGVMGAAIATCISYIVVFIFRVFDTKKYLKISYKKTKYFEEILLIFLASIVIYMENNFYVFNITLVLFIIIILLEKSFWTKITKSIIKRQ